MDGLGEPESGPPEPESSSDWLNVALLVLGGLIAILLVLVLIVLFTGDDGRESVADTSSTEAPSTSQPATTSSTLDTTTTTQAATSTAAPTTTTAAPTTTAAAPATTTTTTTVVSLPSFVTNDCIGYDPAALEIEDLGAIGWRLNAGPLALQLYDNEIDALRGLAVASNHTELCFMSRDNTRADRMEYIREFWNGDSGITVPIPGPENCLDYDPAALEIEDMGAIGWRLNAGSVPLLGYDNEADALRGLALAGNYTKRCLIGIGNLRADRFRYLHEYWR